LGEIEREEPVQALESLQLNLATLLEVDSWAGDKIVHDAGRREPGSQHAPHSGRSYRRSGRVRGVGLRRLLSPRVCSDRSPARPLADAGGEGAGPCRTGESIAANPTLIPYSSHQIV